MLRKTRLPSGSAGLGFNASRSCGSTIPDGGIGENGLLLRIRPSGMVPALPAAERNLAYKI